VQLQDISHNSNIQTVKTDLIQTYLVHILIRLQRHPVMTDACGWTADLSRDLRRGDLARDLRVEQGQVLGQQCETTHAGKHM